MSKEEIKLLKSLRKENSEYRKVLDEYGEYMDVRFKEHSKAMGSRYNMKGYIKRWNMPILQKLYDVYKKYEDNGVLEE